jgi:hypothetical protein
MCFQNRIYLETNLFNFTELSFKFSDTNIIIERKHHHNISYEDILSDCVDCI